MNPPVGTQALRAASARKWFGLFFAALAGIVLFSLTDLSATRAFRSPWWLPFTLVQALPLLVLAGLAVENVFTLRKPSVVFAGVALSWAGVFLSAVFSPYRHEALAWSLGGFSLLATGLVCACALAPRSPGFPARLARWQTLIGWVFAAMLLDSLALWLAGDLLPGLERGARLQAEIGPEAWSFSWGAFRNGHPFGHPNYTAGLAVLMIPWFGGLAWSRRGRARAGWSAALLFALALLLSSGSRGGLLGLLAAAGGGGAFAVWRGGRRTRRLALLALTVGAALLAANPRMRQTLTTVADPARMPSSSDLERRSMIEAGLLMGADRWLLGWGPATTPSVFPAYRPRLGVSLENSFQLHSQPVTLWAEGGALAVLGAALLLAGLARQARRALSSPGPGPASACAASAALSLLGYAVFLCTDTQLDVAFFATACAVLAAMLWACGESAAVPLADVGESGATGSPGPRRRALVVPFAILVSAVAVATALIPAARARLALAAAFAAFDAGRTREFIARTRTVLAGHPGEFALANLLASTELGLARASTDAAEKSRLESDAIRDWETSLALRPWQELPHTNLAWLLLPRDPARALREFEEAARWVPDKRGVHLGRALALLQLHRSRETVVAALARECLLDPGFVLSPLWRGRPLRPLRADVFQTLDAQLAALAADPRKPHWVSAEARDYAALLAWWEGRRDAASTGRALLSPARHACFAALADPAAPLASSHPAASWQLLARAAKTTGEERLRLLRAAQARLDRTALPDDPGNPVLRMLDARVAARWPAVADPPAAPDLVRRVRYERPGYDILVRNTDFPVLQDAYEADRTLSSDYLAPLLPRTGWCLPLAPQPPAIITLDNPPSTIGSP